LEDNVVSPSIQRRIDKSSCSKTAEEEHYEKNIGAGGYDDGRGSG
jgi:hypothetical protein